MGLDGLREIKVREQWRYRRMQDYLGLKRGYAREKEKKK